MASGWRAGKIYGGRALSEAPHKPRVVLLTYPGLVGAQVINRFAAEKGLELVGVGLSNRVYRGLNHARSALRMLRRTGAAFTGWEITMTDLSWLLLRLRGCPAALRSVEVRPIRDINAPATLRWLASLRADYIASCFFNQVIREEVIQLAPLGCVNMHAGLLPELRGPEPCFRALERGYRETGLTVHFIDEPTIDTGPILHQEKRAICTGMSLVELDVRLWADGADVLARWIAGNSTRAEPLRWQPRENQDYSSWPTASEVRSFRRNGGRLFDLGTYMQQLSNAVNHRAPEYLPAVGDSLNAAMRDAGQQLC